MLLKSLCGSRFSCQLSSERPRLYSDMSYVPQLGASLEPVWRSVPSWSLKVFVSLSDRIHTRAASGREANQKSINNFMGSLYHTPFLPQSFWYFLIPLCVPWPDLWDCSQRTLLCSLHLLLCPGAQVQALGGADFKLGTLEEKRKLSHLFSPLSVAVLYITVFFSSLPTTII